MVESVTGRILVWLVIKNDSDDFCACVSTVMVINED